MELVELAMAVLVEAVARRSLQRAPRLAGFRRLVTDALEHRLHRVCGKHDADEDSDCLDVPLDRDPRVPVGFNSFKTVTQLAGET